MARLDEVVVMSFVIMRQEQHDKHSLQFTK